ncbi:ankyrin repeat domain-containing protein, partial [archaeon]
PDDIKPVLSQDSQDVAASSEDNKVTVAHNYSQQDFLRHFHPTMLINARYALESACTLLDSRPEVFVSLFMSVGSRLSWLALPVFQINRWADFVRTAVAERRGELDIHISRLECTFKSWNVGIVDLISAVQSTNVEAVSHLLSMKADANSLDSEKYTVLILACKRGNVEIVKALLDAGADVLRTCHNKSAVQWAEANGFTQVVTLLYNEKYQLHSISSRDKAAHQPVVFLVERHKASAQRTWTSDASRQSAKCLQDVNVAVRGTDGQLKLCQLLHGDDMDFVTIDKDKYTVLSPLSEVPRSHLLEYGLDRNVVQVLKSKGIKVSPFQYGIKIM